MIRVMTEMIHIKPSPAVRGSDVYENEQPKMVVHLSEFLIDKFPVTNSDFARFIEAGGYNLAKYWLPAGYKFISENKIQQPLYWTDNSFNGDHQPVTGISWWEASAYAKFTDKILPTEAQWEYAAGFGERMYPWGNSTPSMSHANFAPGCEPAELRRRTERVDFHHDGVSASGCWDMAGNVGEWCLDNYAPDYSWDETGVDPVYIFF